ncbi:MAG: hypothetical protein KDB79_02965, partial [Acidobacteria bacterium]|nr:hypothetical protein [Acidobacteriota bacterium]
MNLLEAQENIENRVLEKVRLLFELEFDNIAIEIPPKTEFGDVAFPIAFEITKHLKQSTGEKQNPRAIAEKLKAELIEIDFVHEIQIAGPGYLNVFYDRSKFLRKALDSDLLPKALLATSKHSP